MKIARLAGVAFAAILAVTAMAASTAMAAGAPEFLMLPEHKGFTSVAEGASILKTLTTSISCEHSFSNGEVTGMDTIGKVVVKYTGCVLTTSVGCTEKFSSITGKTGEIVTNAIKGLLGTVKTSEAASGVGILFEPESGKRFFTFRGTTVPCNVPESTISGNLAGEVTPVHKLQGTIKIVLLGAGHEQMIREIVVLGKTVTPELEWFGSEASLTTTDLTTYTGAVEVC